MLKLFLAFLALSSVSHGATKLAAIFGDHMLFQAGQPVRIWGWDDAGKSVSVKVAGKSAVAKAGADGAWSVELPALKAGGPYEMEVNGSASLKVSDVLAGELWLGSGQSNMEFALQNTHDAAKELPVANDSQLRLFTIERSARDTVQKDVVGQWQVCTPESAKGFSAVAYHFGKGLRKPLKSPVGLIASSWGGTPAENWTPRDVLLANPAFAAVVKQWDADPLKSEPWSKGMQYDLAISDLKLLPKGGKGKALSLEFTAGSFSHNEKADSSGAVEAKGGSGRYFGKVMGGSWGSAMLTLKGGQPMDLSAYEAVEFKIKGRGRYGLSVGQASITDYDFYTSKDYDASAAPQTVRVGFDELKQGGWGAPKAFAIAEISSLSFVLRTPYWPESAGVLYNAMIAPITRLPIKGVIWYQGESNSGRGRDYRSLLQAMVGSWRKAWGNEFPFLIVQLANYMDPCQSPCESGWAETRDSQRLAASDMKNADFAVITDLGEAKDIHPRNKRDVGLRLAGLALQLSYGGKAEAGSPRPSSVKKAGSAALVSFSRGNGIKAGAAKLKGFELAGADGKFYLAKAEIAGKNVKVSAPEVPAPVKVRYAWNHNPETGLQGLNGLPATCFEETVLP